MKNLGISTLMKGLCLVAAAVTVVWVRYSIRKVS